VERINARRAKVQDSDLEGRGYEYGREDNDSTYVRSDDHPEYEDVGYEDRNGRKFVEEEEDDDDGDLLPSYTSRISEQGLNIRGNENTQFNEVQYGEEEEEEDQMPPPSYKEHHLHADAYRGFDNTDKIEEYIFPDTSTYVRSDNDGTYVRSDKIEEYISPDRTSLLFKAFVSAQNNKVHK
jgi:hypothetical protein